MGRLLTLLKDKSYEIACLTCFLIFSLFFVCNVLLAGQNKEFSSKKHNVDTFRADLSKEHDIYRPPVIQIPGHSLHEIKPPQVPLFTGLYVPEIRIGPRPISNPPTWEYDKSFPSVHAKNPLSGDVTMDEIKCKFTITQTKAYRIDDLEDEAKKRYIRFNPVKIEYIIVEKNDVLQNKWVQLRLKEEALNPFKDKLNAFWKKQVQDIVNENVKLKEDIRPLDENFEFEFSDIPEGHKRKYLYRVRIGLDDKAAFGKSSMFESRIGYKYVYADKDNKELVLECVKAEGGKFELKGSKNIYRIDAGDEIKINTGELEIVVPSDFEKNEWNWSTEKLKFSGKVIGKEEIEVDKQKVVCSKIQITAKKDRQDTRYEILFSPSMGIVRTTDGFTLKSVQQEFVSNEIEIQTLPIFKIYLAWDTASELDVVMSPNPYKHKKIEGFDVKIRIEKYESKLKTWVWSDEFYYSSWMLEVECWKKHLKNGMILGIPIVQGSVTGAKSLSTNPYGPSKTSKFYNELKKNFYICSKCSVVQGTSGKCTQEKCDGAVKPYEVDFDTGLRVDEKEGFKRVTKREYITCILVEKGATVDKDKWDHDVKREQTASVGNHYILLKFKDGGKDEFAIVDKRPKECPVHNRLGGK